MVYIAPIKHFLMTVHPALIDTVAIADQDDLSILEQGAKDVLGAMGMHGHTLQAYGSFQKARK
jgi:hypothetical protein